MWGGGERDEGGEEQSMVEEGRGGEDREDMRSSLLSLFPLQQHSIT